MCVPSLTHSLASCRGQSPVPPLLCVTLHCVYDCEGGAVSVLPETETTVHNPTTHSLSLSLTHTDPTRRLTHPQHTNTRTPRTTETAASRTRISRRGRLNTPQKRKTPLKEMGDTPLTHPSTGSSSRLNATSCGNVSAWLDVGLCVPGCVLHAAL